MIVKICRKCGMINSWDNDECSNCSEDLFNSFQKNLDFSSIGKVYDFKTNSIKELVKNELNKPTANLKEDKKNDNEIIEPKENKDEKNINSGDEKKFKICPTCGYKNEEDAVECEECGKSLTRVAANEVKEKIYLMVNLDGDNKIELNLADGESFYINRVRSKFLKNFINLDYISKNHCCIKRVKDDYFLIDLGSSNGTYLIIDNKDVKLIPNTEYKLKIGDTFFLLSRPLNINFSFQKK